jgi:hypothetical protein
MRFKTTNNIFKDNQEYFESFWMNGNKVYYPPKKEWDYSRELQIEDVDFWEVIYEASGGIGIYASWSPYAEFYLIRRGWDIEKNLGLETYYGKGALKIVNRIASEMNINLGKNKIWVEPDEMWLYE